MTALSSEPVSLEEGTSARADIRVVLWLGALPLLSGALLPWVLLRPNRLAPGELLRLPLAITLVLLLLAVLPALLIRRSPELSASAAAGSIVAAFWLLGERTAGALTGQAEFARASAASGFWLYMVGALIAAFGAAQTGWVPRLWAWAWVPATALLVLSGQLSTWSVLVEARSEGPRWVQEFGQHLRLVGSALGLAVFLGVPLTLWAVRWERVAAGALGIANAVQTIPSLALLGLLIVPLAALSRAFPALREVGVAGIGVAPALTAMTLYALLPVLRNGIEALRGVPPGTVDAARGMGMTPAQTFWRVELPLALPVWLSGVRQAAVMLVGVAAVAALIGAGGLGTYIFKGLQSAATDLILLGAVPAALLAVLVDALLRAAERWLSGRLGRAGDE
ncbi:putative proline/glycine betaine ABC transporter, permease component [Deinococcus deserti VCD115]|uniref:Putative proline/glycine betaine ABC transporter, permease component n=1 Tax=Deinococcus deserti (strain DSM 17065 / CIP 109153 / LMG 22923 / VCD115) TaxID=546414 RepID=C1CXL0_DEIDV|nr:putative proline/glycine betaine ABC transporter, permease component [Deinococcus deserti VCD115]